MEERDVLLKNIRPQIEAEIGHINPTEQFQNEVLRPILKLQNEIILAHFKSYLKQHKMPFTALKQSAQKETIQNSIKRDLSLRNQLVPLITSMLTVEEYKYFSSNRADVAKRIVGMVIQRLQSQLQALY